MIASSRVAGRLEEVAMQVVGIAKDGRYNSLGEDPAPFVFYDHRQVYEAQTHVLARTTGQPAEVATLLLREVAELDARLPVYDVKTLEAHLGTALFPVRVAAGLLGLMGGLASLLAAIGLYGVLSYSVSRRTGEIGLRLAGAGVVDGLALAAGVTRFRGFLLHGVSPLDLVTFTGLAALLLLVALAAAALPARRAARVEPMLALRAE